MVYDECHTMVVHGCLEILIFHFMREVLFRDIDEKC